MKQARSAWLVVAAALVPLALFVILQAGFQARDQRRTIEQRALAEARQLILAADVETVRVDTVLEALSTSRPALEDDWVQLGARLAGLSRGAPGIRGMAVQDAATGRLLFAQGAPLGQRIQIADARRADRPLFTGYAPSAACRCLMFERRFAGRGGSPRLVTLLVDSRVFTALLPPESETVAVSALVGPQGRFVARSLDGAQRFGQPGSTYLRGAVFGDQREGVYRGFTLEGVENYSAFARSARNGWSAHIALGSRYIDDPSRRFLASLGGAALLSLLLAALLVTFAIRQMREARAFAERLQQAQKMEALGQLTGGLAHDFNNLLTPVVGTLDQLARRDGLDERGRRLAAGALASAQRAARLTAQLLAFSRRQKLAIAPVDLAPLVAGADELITRTLGSRHRFALEDESEGGAVLTDATQIELALLNLAINARDASPEGALVRLRVEGRADEPFVTFAMIDCGAGMDEETKRRATEPFFTTKPPGQGTGLGLAQVFGVVEQSGGTVDIDSQKGAGTTIRLRIPRAAVATDAADPDAPQQDRSHDAATEAEPEALRLLVVDDDPRVRAMLAATLSEAGHAVDSVACGTSALAALATEDFDLVVTDFRMPVMRGDELIAESRRVRPHTRFLVVSGFSDTEALDRACPDCDKLAKPFTADALLAAVETSARKPREPGSAGD